MKRYALFALLILFALMITLPVMSQDDATAVPTDTDIPAATAEATAEATQEAVVIDINVEVTDNTDGEGSTDTGDTAPSTGMSPDLVFIGVVLLSLVFGLADKFTNYRMSKDLAKAIPPEWLPVIEQGANTARRIVYERAGAFADSTEGTFDNNLLDEDMKRAGWEFYIDPTTGNRHARKIVAPAG